MIHDERNVPVEKVCSFCDSPISGDFVILAQAFACAFLFMEGGFDMELWDAYTCEGVATGETLVRDEPIPAGRYHLVCEVLVRHRDGSYLAMRRDKNKKGFRGWWETTAGGSALRGEDMWQCACRELKEETGLASGDFHQIGYEVWPGTHCIYSSFLCNVDCDKNTVILQEGETVDKKYATAGEIIAMRDRGEFVSFRYLDQLLDMIDQENG